MSDIVERLRVGGDGPCDCEILGEAAAEIERLHDMRTFDRQELAAERAEIERLKAALREIHHATSFTMLATNHGRRGDIAFEIADAALEGK